MHIVLIDTDTESTLILSSSLKRRGYHVDTFTSYMEPSQQLCHDTAYLFLIDPQTLENTGHNDLEKLAKQFAQSPIIILSSDDSLDALELAIHINVAHYIVKPFDLTDVLTTIQKTIAIAVNQKHNRL
jgi:DNA-binding NtrC family response regulator